MSQENVNRFWKQVGQEGALRQEFDSLMQSAERVPANEIVSLGEKHGLSFTRDELGNTLEAAAQASQGELSDRQLESVAGGYESLSLNFTKITYTTDYEQKVNKAYEIGSYGFISF